MRLAAILAERDRAFAALAALDVRGDARPAVDVLGAHARRLDDAAIALRAAVPSPAASAGWEVGAIDGMWPCACRPRDARIDGGRVLCGACGVPLRSGRSG